MNDMDADTNRLTVDGVPFTPAGLQVREVLNVTDDDVLCVVQRTPELLPDDSLPFLWQSNAADHDARSFDVVSIRYDGTWEPLTYAPGQWTMSRAGNGCVVTGRGMDDATVQMQHCMNIVTTDEMVQMWRQWWSHQSKTMPKPPDSRRTYTSPDLANVACTRQSCSPRLAANTRMPTLCRCS